MMASISMMRNSRIAAHHYAKGVTAMIAVAACALASGASAWADTGAAPAHTGDTLAAALNMAWVLIGGFLVMFMQVGFAMLETGFTRAKNAVNTTAMNLMVCLIGLSGFWLAGYALMMGGVSQWPSLGELAPAAAVMIGLVAGLLVVASVLALERRFRVDDPVGAISVHGVCGLWGALALEILATELMATAGTASTVRCAGFCTGTPVSCSRN